jgi:integrase/recombinase XerD
MPKIAQVKLLKKIKIPTASGATWVWALALFDSKGRVRRDHVLVNGKDEAHNEGSYYLEWWEGGKRHRESVSPNAFAAADIARAKQAELDAVRNGIIPAAAVVEVAPDRTTLKQALDAYKDYVQYHRSLRTFRTYRPILDSFKEFCTKTYIDDVERQDLLGFATHLMKEGQKGKSIYNKLVVLSQVMKQHGKSKLVYSAPGALAPARVILSRAINAYWPHPTHSQAHRDFAVSATYTRCPSRKTENWTEKLAKSAPPARQSSILD